MSTTLERLDVAQTTRLKILAVRRSLRAGEVSLYELMISPPRELAGVLLVDVLAWMGSTQGRRSSRMTTLGRRAVRDGVNLLQPVGAASLASRAWVAANGPHGLKRERWV